LGWFSKKEATRQTGAEKVKGRNNPTANKGVILWG